MIMNMGMTMTPKDFMDFWMNLGRRIQDAADSDEGDIINREHYSN
jgi:hypothetical protein